MSIAEELHKTIDELSEEQQQGLLETARELLREESNEDQELNNELTSRYDHLRQHPDQVVNARESNQQLREKYGW